MASMTFERDGNLEYFARGWNGISQGKARRAMARAANRVASSVRSRSVREVTKQSSIPRKMVAAALKRRSAKPSGLGDIEASVWGRGKPISLKYFKARQLSYGVRAKVAGKWRRYPGTFMGPRPGVIAPALHGNVFHRTTSSRLPIEMIYGPSIPEELVKGESKRQFEQTVRSMLPQRIDHEIGRLLPGA